MSGAALAFSSLGAHITGVEEDGATGVMRVYVGHRYKGQHFLLADEDAKARVRREWNLSYCGHLLMHRDEIPILAGERSGAS